MCVCVCACVLDIIIQSIAMTMLPTNKEGPCVCMPLACMCALCVLDIIIQSIAMTMLPVCVPCVFWTLPFRALIYYDHIAYKWGWGLCTCACALCVLDTTIQSIAMTLLPINGRGAYVHVPCVCWTLPFRALLWPCCLRMLSIFSVRALFLWCYDSPIL